MVGKRKNIPLDVKREVIRKKDAGMGNSAIGREMGLSESTVRTIYKCKDDILKCIEAYGTSKLDGRVIAHANAELVKTERYLVLWVNRKESEGVPLDKRAIIDQAKKFYAVICRKNGKLPCGFKASTGWLYNFLKRKKIRNVRLTGEGHSADEIAAREFPQILEGIISDGDYHPDCVYNMDEAGLVYKRMPKSTFIAKTVKQARGRKADKTRFTVVFCVNATGTHKVKPMVIHTAKHPRCFGRINMKDAPVYWRQTANAWMTADVMKDWLLNCFVPEAKRKCQEAGRPFDVVLTMDNCKPHPTWLENLHPKVRVVFLPPNTTSLVQPLDQEIIATVKTKYQHTVFLDLLRATESNVELQQMVEDGDGELEEPAVADVPGEVAPEMPQELMSVYEFWRRFTVKDAVDHLMRAWEDINKATIRHAWRHLAPNLVPEGPTDPMPIQRLDETIAAAVLAAREVPGCSDVTDDELLQVHALGEETTPEDIMQAAEIDDALENQRQREGDMEVQEEGGESGYKLSRSDVSNILSLGDVFLEGFAGFEKDGVRFSEFKSQFNSIMHYYRNLHMKQVHEGRQSLITRFVRQPALEQEPEPEPEPGPSTSAVEETNDLFTEEDLEEFEGFLNETV